MGKAPAYALCAPGGRSRTRGFLCALALGCLVGGDAIGSHSSHRPRSLWLQKRDSGKCVLRLSGGSAAVGSEPKLDEVPGSPTRSEARRAFDFLSQDLNDALAQAEGEAVGGKQLFFGDEEKARSLAARLDAISEGVTPPPETAKPEAASTWDPPKGNQPQDVEGIVPPLDLAGEADPAAAPKDAAPADGKSGAQRYFEETGVNITATAGAIAAYRAAVTAMNHSYMDDPYAAKFAKAVCPDKLAAAMEKPAAELARFAVRTRFFDEFVRDAVLNRGILQIVMIGAGFDARALRAVDLRWDLAPKASALDELEGNVLTIYEIDHPEVLSLKQRLLAGVGRGRGMPIVRRLAVDVTDKYWSDTLRMHGFSPTRPSAFLLEGVLYYYPAEQVRRLLSDIDQLSAPGSRIGFSAVSAAAARPTGHWQWGTDDPEGFLAEFGFSEAQAVALGDPAIAHGWDMSAVAHSGPKKTLYVTGSRPPAKRSTPERLQDAAKSLWQRALPTVKWTRWFVETALTTGHQLRIPFPKWLQALLP